MIELKRQNRENFGILLIFLALNSVIFIPYLANPNYNIMGEVDPNPLLILNSVKEINLHFYAWTENWNLGGNTDWQRSRILLGCIFYILNAISGVKSRFLFEIFLLTISAFGMYLFTKKYVFDENILASFFSGLLYVYNPYVLIWLERNIILLFPFLVFPSLAKLSCEVLRANKIKAKHLIYSIILLNFASINLNPGTFGVMVLALVLIVISQKLNLEKLYKLLLVLSIGITSTLWGLLPIICHKFIYTSQMGKILTLERFHSLGVSLVRSLTLTHLRDFNMKPHSFAFFPGREIYHESLLMVLPVFSIFSVFFLKKENNALVKKVVLACSILLILSIFFSFSDASSSPLRDFFVWLETNTIYSIFRNNFKFGHMTLIAYSILIPYTFLRLARSVNKKQIFFIVLLSGFTISVSGSPFFLGKLHKKQFSGIPSDSSKIAEALNENAKGGRIILLPGQHLQYYKFHRIYLTRPILFSLVEKPVIFQDTAIYPYDLAIRDKIQYTYEKLLKYKPNKLFDLFGINYVVIDKNLDLSFQHNLNPVEIRKTKNYNLLKNHFTNNHLSKVYESNNYTTFYYDKEHSDIFAIPSEVIITGCFPLEPKVINSIPLDMAILSFRENEHNTYGLEWDKVLLDNQNEKGLILTALRNKSIQLNTGELFYKNSLNNEGGWHIVTTNERPLEISKHEYGFGTISTRKASTKYFVFFNVDEPDRYILFVNLFKNQNGRKVKICLDGKSMEIETKSKLNKFVYKELGRFYLKKGKHKLMLKNVRGFNAVSSFVLVPEEEYNKEKEKIVRILRKKTVIYLFETKSVPGRITRQDIDIIKDGTYRIALEGKGKFNVNIGDESYVLKSDFLKICSSPSFSLDAGKCRLAVAPSEDTGIVRPRLDAVYLYSTETNETINQLFAGERKPAKIINYTKINPTFWKIKISAAESFMLSFAESYDPLWEAKVHKNGKLVEKTGPVPLYGVINGFWINEAGNLKIVVRYKPQNWFRIGSAISGLTFFGCIGFLIYEWRKRNLRKK